jgi:hypothetical protein
MTIEALLMRCGARVMGGVRQMYALLFLLALVARQRNELLVLLSLSRRHCVFSVSRSQRTGEVKAGGRWVGAVCAVYARVWC